jgi:outer membrane protein
MHLTMRSLLIGSIGLLVSAPLAAQNVAPRAMTLTLSEALTLAKQNNAQYLQVLNQRSTTRIGVRQAYAALGPSLGSGLNFGWREGRQEYFAGQPIGSGAATLSSGYGLNLQLGYSYQSLLAPKTANRRVDAADANVSAGENQLRLQVTNQYLTALEAERTADLQDSLVVGQQLQAQLAKARETAGAGTLLDTKSAELGVSRAQITALTARNRAVAAKMTLFLTIGVPYPGPASLTTEPPAPTEPTFKADDLIAQAKASNPNITEARVNEMVASLERRAAGGAYLFPTLSFSTGVGGSTNMLTDASGPERTWPFDFNRNPIQFSVGFSYPIWNQYNREANVQSRTIASANARNATRQQELQVATDVTTALLDLQLAWQTIALQNQAVDNARQAMLLARERYTGGSASFIELSNASDNYQSAENQRLSAIYGYHRAFAALEAAVGRPLR